MLARRLSSELAEVIRLLPDSARGASAMSRALNLDRATCQRIVATCGLTDPTAEALVNLPGIQGLRQFIDTAAERIDSVSGREALASASTAIDLFENALERLAGSQRRLKARLQADTAGFDIPPGAAGLSPSSAPGDDSALRESLFRAAAAVVGRWSQLAIDTRIVWPVPTDPNKTEGARVRGLIGHVAGPYAVPLEVGETSSAQTLDGSTPAFATMDSKPASGRTPQSLLREFCTQPLPRVITRATAGKSVHTLDFDGPHGRLNDVVMAHRGSSPDPHPATLEPAHGEMWWLSAFPARRMQFDVFVHRQVLRGATPSLEVHLWGPDVGRPGTTRWSTRFPGGPKLDRLGGGLSMASASGYERYGELLGTVFSQIGWDPAEFELFRCETNYPIWRAGYCMRFDFGSHPEE